MEMLKKTMTEEQRQELHTICQVLRWHFRHKEDAVRDDMVFRLMMFTSGLPDIQPPKLNRLVQRVSPSLAPQPPPSPSSEMQPLPSGPAGDAENQNGAGSEDLSDVSSLNSRDEEAIDNWVYEALQRNIEFQTQCKAKLQEPLEEKEVETCCLLDQGVQLTKGTKRVEHETIVPPSGAFQPAARKQSGPIDMNCASIL